MKKKPAYSDNPHYSPEIQQMINETEACLNCGKKLRLDQRKDGRRNRGYCSMFCLGQKSPKMAYVEKVYAASVRDVIINMLNNGATIVAVSGRLGIERCVLYQWLNKLNIRKKVVWE